MDRWVSLGGIFVFIAIAYAFSANRKAVSWRTVVVGIGLQFLFALFILKTQMGLWIFSGANTFFTGILNFAGEGTSFVFGPLANIPLMGDLFGARYGFVFAVQVTGIIIFMASLSAVLYHLRILQAIVWVFAKIMHATMKISGAESLSAAANIFVGQTESPLIIRPYLKNLTKSELMCVMTGGFATIAGGVMAAFVGMGVNAGHLLSASVMSAPATIVFAKLLMPETSVPETADNVSLKGSASYANIFDAACTGAREGLYLALNVMGMLIAFIALIALINGVLGSVGISLETIFGFIFWPVSWLMGVPTHECMTMGTLLGKKMVINEFVAYIDFINIRETLSERTQIIATYALCGFANFSSIAIQIGGIGSLEPGRKTDLAKVGLKAMIGGTAASLITANIAATLL
jgi:concentrative nucleoside transporter, CNT family